MPFDAPSAPGGGMNFADHLGELILFKVHDWETGIPTVHGDSDAARVDAFVLTGPDAPVEYLDTLVFPKILRNQLKKKIGGFQLGRLGQGQKKPGQNAPWVLEDFNADDAKLADRFVAGLSSANFSKEDADSPY